MADKDTKSHGKEQLSWGIKEYHEHPRGMFWYFVAVVLAIALIIYAISVRNFLFAFIVIMFGVILITHNLRSPGDYQFAITELGIKFGQRFYPWKDIDQFWIAYEPPEVKTLYFEFGGLRPRLPIPLEETDPNQVREILKEVLEEDTSKTEEPISDWLARVLKI